MFGLFVYWTKLRLLVVFWFEVFTRETFLLQHENQLQQWLDTRQTEPGSDQTKNSFILKVSDFLRVCVGGFSVCTCWKLSSIPSAFSLGVTDNTHSPTQHTHTQVSITASLCFLLVFTFIVHERSSWLAKSSVCNLTQVSHQVFRGHNFSLSRKFGLKTHKDTQLLQSTTQHNNQQRKKSVELN